MRRSRNILSPRFQPNLRELEARDVPASIGSFDPGFGNNGTANFNIATGTNVANAVVTQRDGKIVIAGTTDSSTAANADFFVMRLNSNGSLDTSFANNGVLTFGTAGKQDVATGIGLQSDGNIVVSGFTNKGADFDAVAFRLTNTGGLDASFGAAGFATINQGGDEKAYAMTVMPDDRIVLAGGANNDDNVMISRLTKAGLPDTFGTAGTLVVPLGLVEVARSVGVQADGRITVAGYQNNDGFVMRALADGTGTDTTFGLDVFGANKFTKVDFAGGADKLFAVEVQADGSVIASGFATVAGNVDTAVTRLTSTGAFETKFAGNGKATVDLGGTDVSWGVGIQGDGKVVLIGTANDDFYVARLQSDGSALDAVFNNGAGKSTVNILGTERAFAGTTDSQGRVIVVGQTASSVGVARGFLFNGAQPFLLVSGSPDGKAVALSPTFDTAGKYADPGTTLTMFQSFNATVRTATADVNGDGIPDQIAVAGPGALPQMTVIDGSNGKTLVATFNVFESTFTGGMFVAAADIDGDGRAEIVVSPDLSGGPVVAVYSGSKLSSGLTGDAAQIVRFFGIEDPNFRGGARPSLGDVNNDGTADLVISAGFGGGPRIAIFNGKDLAAGNSKPSRLIPDFFAFEDTVRNGAYVAVGDVNGDGFGDLVFGGGPNGGPRVRVVNSKVVLGLAPFSALDKVTAAGVQLADFISGDGASRGGITVAVRDVDMDGQADIVTGSGQKLAPKVLVYKGKSLLSTPSSNPTPDQTITPFANATLDGGVFVG